MQLSHFYNEVVGIIGGTGPEATNYFTSLLVSKRGHVKSDQDHIPFVLINNPQIPDRSKFVLYGGESPLPEMIHTGLILKDAGASFLVIPCNTAHAFTDELEKIVRIPVLNMVDLTIGHIKNTHGKNAKIGLLATDGTIISKTYNNAIMKIAPLMNLILPSKQMQKDIMVAIYNIKKYSSNENSFKLLKKAGKELVSSGADVIILGCTEIPLVMTPQERPFPKIDPMVILAKEVIKKTLASKRNSSSKIQKDTISHVEMKGLYKAHF